MQIRILVVGKPRREVLDVFVADYLHRLEQIWPSDIVTISEERVTGHRSDSEIMTKEAERIHEKIPTGWVSIALDRTGKALDSMDLAQALRAWQDSSIRGVVFVIGGAVGLDAAFARRCTMRLSLGAMTYPHDLALVIVAEQIYRAATIVKGLPYHR